jgi:hypothetical protein
MGPSIIEGLLFIKKRGEIRLFEPLATANPMFERC